ncbi:Swt1 family HEPN domain-containing protein, partial [Caulobacter sp. 3R27C2-B]|uniref:Swt1 family HEPN domain-containing protein n=1 Tax=Caulobacter sp. 3R27C2-B TaxID=2502219 RepID=UPI001BB21A24
IRTARSRTSGENLFVVLLLIVAPISQELGPPANPARFNMRDLIESTMIDAKGREWWKTAVPQAVRDNAQKNYDREASEGLPPRSDRLIDYTTFGELGEIVRDNWDTFSGMFSNATRNRVLRVINRLNLVRGPIAHCNFLPEEEAIRLKLAIRDWYKLME